MLKVTEQIEVSFRQKVTLVLELYHHQKLVKLGKNKANHRAREAVRMAGTLGSLLRPVEEIFLFFKLFGRRPQPPRGQQS